MLTIYHNPRCKHSRLGLQYLQNKNVDFEIREYLKNLLTKKEIKEIIKKLNVKPVDIIRKQEEIFKKELKNKNYSDEEWIDIIFKNLNLLHRPIIVDDEKAVLAQPPEEIEKLL